MTLTSLPILAGIACFVATYWLLPRAWRPAASVAATAALLGAYSPWSLALLATQTAIVWAGLRLGTGRGWVHLLGAATIAGGFVVYRLAEADGSLPVQLGFAYYSLRLIHVLLDAYKGKLPPLSAVSLIHYAAFAPIVPLGPFERVQHFEREFLRHRWNASRFSYGLERILIGYTKFALLANLFTSGTWMGAVKGSSALAHSQLSAFLESMAYGLGLYFQFAGYSDVAIGVAALLGMRLGENFMSPFLQPNIGAFWNAWHISLSHWCRDYVYYPIVAALRVRAFGIVASMLVLALWHEFSWRYVAWGLYHGLGIVGWRLWERLRPNALVAGPAWLTRAWTACATAITFVFVSVGFTLTAAPDLRHAAARMLQILGILQ